MINYLVQIVLFQTLFLAAYDLFLNKETFFKWNRLYLIATPILSLIIPLLKFDVFKNSVSQEYIVWLPEVVLNPQVIIEQTTNSVATFNYLNLLFYVGVAIFSVSFLIKLAKILRIVSSNTIVKKDYYSLVLLENKQSAFSFFNYIFIDKKLEEKKELQIIQHELVHCKQYHTADLLFFEIFKILMWFNPMVYMYQKRITLLHEYISDAEVVKETDKTSYFNKLLSETFNVENISFVNQFYKQSLIKKRIAMITKNKSQKMKQLKYLVLIPLLGSMLLYSSCETTIDEPNGVQELTAKKEIVTFYRNEGDGVKTMKREKETYLDVFGLFGTDKPNLSLVEFKYKDLATEEKEEYDNFTQDYKSKMRTYGKIEFQLFKLNNGRKIIVHNFTANRTDKKDYTNAEDVPFAIIEETPSFESCDGDNLEKRKCFSMEINKHVARKFNVKLAENLGLEPGKKKIYIQFKILKNGEVEIVGARAPHKDLENEAKRVINLLPKMTPGKHNGKEVNVTYMLPISFNVE